MAQTKRSQRSSAVKLLCILLTCVLMYGILCTTVSATDSAAAESTAAADTTAETQTDTTAVTLSTSDLQSLGVIISAAVADSKAEDTRTPRDKLTAAYLAGDIEAAKAAIKEANDEQDEPLDINYDTLTIDNVAELIQMMKTDVDLEAPKGFFAAIQLAAGSVLSWLTQVLGAGNYIIGIVIFALIVEVAMLPLTIKQQQNSVKQAKLKPKEMAIRKKYHGRDDQVTKNKVNTEIQELYQKEGFNPASGCLPMLIQLPIVFILYYVVINPIVYVMRLSSGISSALVTFANTSTAAGGLGATVNSTRGTIEIASLISDYGDEFFTKLKDFLYFSNGDAIANTVQGATLPNFNFFGLNFGLVPNISHPDWLLAIPVLTFLVYFGSMKLTKKMTYQPAATDQAMGCSNNIMDIGMPAFSAYICFVVPAALGFYWMIKSIFGTLSRLVLTKFIPLPQFTEEDYKAAEREIIKGKPVGKSASSVSRTSASGKPVRSLHHIDDEDFDDTRDKVLDRKAKLEEAEKAETETSMKTAGNMKNEDDRPMLTLKDMFKKRKDNDSSDSENKNDKSDKK